MNFARIVSLAWRNLWRNRRRTLITLSTIAIGFALAVISIGLGDGGHNNMVHNGIRMGEGHLTLQPEGYKAAPANFKFLHDGGAIVDKLRGLNLPGRIAPRITLQVLAATANNSLGAGLQGMDMSSDPLNAILRPKLVEGAWLEPGDTQGILIGGDMARKLKAKIGTRLVVMAGSSSGEVQSRLTRVRGIFHSGVAELDGFFMISTLEVARYFLLAEGGTEAQQPLTRIAIFLDSQDDVPAVKAHLQQQDWPAGTAVLDWQEMMPDLVNFIVLDDIGNYIWLMFVLTMVTFGILNTILMSVLDRTREFGLLRALGLKSRHLMVMVVTETALLACVALIAGWVLGGAAHAYFATQGLDLSGAYGETLEVSGYIMDTVLYSELSWGRVWFLTGLVFGTTFLSGIYPAIRAARVTPIEALRT